MKKTTLELLNTISNSKDLKQYLLNEDENFITEKPNVLLQQLLDKKGLTKKDIVSISGLDKTYVYQIFQGVKNPSRNKILAILWAMNCDLTEVQWYLKNAMYPTLYPYNKRDSIIIFSIEKGYSLSKTNELLYDLEFEIIE